MGGDGRKSKKKKPLLSKRVGGFKVEEDSTKVWVWRSPTLGAHCPALPKFQKFQAVHVRGTKLR